MEDEKKGEFDWALGEFQRFDIHGWTDHFQVTINKSRTDREGVEDHFSSKSFLTSSFRIGR